MIIVWPLVVSKTVNPNILPGVCKSLEKYILVYSMDAVINAANESIRQNRQPGMARGILKLVGQKLNFVECTESEYENFISESFIEEDYLEEANNNRPNLKPRNQRFSSTRTNINTSNTRTNTRTSTSYKNDSSTNTTYNIQQPRSNQSDRSSREEERNKELGRADARALTGVEPTIGKMDSASISNEPTWNVITDQQGRTTAIGVKVVPFIISNDESLVRLITIDRYRDKLSSTLQYQSRRILKVMHRLGNTAWKNTVGKLLSWTGFVDRDLVSGTITQNWKNDIILQNTAFGDRMFILLNKMDLEDDFISSAGKVKRLFGLGWTSFIIADDINKTVNFCMREYKGMCSLVNYGFLYTDARSQSQVYQDIEDVRKSSGPLFRMKGRKINMITDNLAQYKLDQYSEITESYLTEGVIDDVMQRLKNSTNSIPGYLKSISSAIKRNDIKTASEISKKIIPSNKQININDLINKGKSSPEFKKNFELSFRVFKNSLSGLDDETSKLASLLLCSAASLQKEKNYDIKSDLKKIVMKTRSLINSLEEDDDNFSKDLKVSLIFAVLYVIFNGALIVAILYALVATIPVISTSLIALFPYAAFFIILAAAFSFIQNNGGE